MKERLYELRKALCLNQDEFGAKIGMSKASISALEKGLREITERTIKLICKEFSVNEEWLRRGIGEMFNIQTDGILSELQQKYDMGDIFKNFIKVYLESNEIVRNVIDNCLNEAFEATYKERNNTNILKKDKNNNE